MDLYRDAIVIGGGLAGLSAAFELAERGLKPLVLEAAPQLGGRTSNWRVSGMDVESGIHKFVGFYKEFPRLLERAGLDLDDVFVYQDEIEIRVAEGGDRNFRLGSPRRTGRFGVTALRRPVLTIGGALGNSELLSWRDKWHVVKFFVAGTLRYLRDPESLDRVSVAEYARSLGVSDNVIYTVIWSLSSGLFFLPPDRYSAYPFFAIAWEGTKRFYANRIAVFRGGMTDVMAAPLARAIEKRGGEVRTSSPATRLLIEEGNVTAVVTDTVTYQTSRVVIATQIAPAKKIIANTFGESGPPDAELQKLMSLRDMSGVAVQLELESSALDDDHVIFGANSILGTFGEQSHTTFDRSAGRISTFLTPTEPFFNMPDEEVVASVVADLRRHGVDVANRIKASVVVRHPSEFYLLSPGSEALRPRQRTSIIGLALAGDYTKQPFICSMEGAVVSGRLAVESLV